MDPAASYLWNIEPDKTSNQFTVTHTLSTYDTIQVKLTISKDGCIDSGFNTIFVPANPISAFEINDTIQCLSKNLFTFKNFSTDILGAVENKWNLNNLTFSSDNSPSLSSTISGLNKISLIITNKEGCIDSSSVDATLIPNPIVKFTINDSTQCITQNDFQFTNASSSQIELKKYVWKLDEIAIGESKDLKYISKKIGTHKMKLIAIDSEGCSDSLTKLIVTGEQPEGKKLPFASAVENRPLQLNGRTFVKTTYSWTPKTGLNSYIIQNPTYQYDKEVQYVIAMENENNCRYTDSLIVYIFKEKNIMMPKAFSPNGDGVNDVIKPFLIGIQEFKYLRIFNRWGNLIFQDKDPNKGWDGYYKGTKQSMETYTWVAEGIDMDGQPIKRGGNFLLLR